MQNLSRVSAVYWLKRVPKERVFTELSPLPSDRFFDIKQTLFIFLFIIYLFASTVFFKAPQKGFSLSKITINNVRKWRYSVRSLGTLMPLHEVVNSLMTFLERVSFKSGLCPFWQPRASR